MAAKKQTQAAPDWPDYAYIFDDGGRFSSFSDAEIEEGYTDPPGVGAEVAVYVFSHTSKVKKSRGITLED